MKIYISDKHEIREITLREWKNGNLSPDCFDDMETNVPHDFPTDPDNEEAEDTSATMTEKDYNDIVEWWRDECRMYNERSPYSWFVENLTSEQREEEYAKGAEMILNWD